MVSCGKTPVAKVIIIGGGFSGLAMACKLQAKLGCDDYVIYDRSAAPGGTWYANRYPGCAVDIPAAFYSLSFAPNPEFSQFFPPQAEVLKYFNTVADNFGVSRRIINNVEWEGAYWQDLKKTWLVKLRDLSSGEVFYQQSQVLISAVGPLVNPNEFIIPGMDSFEGDIIHTARWRDGICLDGKDIVVVGNGCSAAQLVPAIASRARSVSQFIRTPQHYVENDNQRVGENLRMIFRYVPGALWIARLLVFLYLEGTSSRFDTHGNGVNARNVSSRDSERYIKEKAPEKYWPLLIPDYDMGCKRRVFDNAKYISSLQRSNIHLTNDPIVTLKPRSVVTKCAKEYPADCILLATGFSLTQFDIELCGRNGLTRDDHWKAFGYKEAYKSVAMSNFPNFFYVLGPNSGKGHTSAIYSIENFVDLIIRVIAPVINGGSASVEVAPGKERDYNEQLHKSIARTVFNNSCGSYFIDRDTQRNWFIYPWNSFRMWFSTHWVSKGDWLYDEIVPNNRWEAAAYMYVPCLSIAMLVFLVAWTCPFKMFNLEGRVFDLVS